MVYKVAHTAYVEGPIPLDRELFDKLGADVVTGFWNTEEQLIEGCRDVDAVVGSAAMQPWTRRVIESLPKLRIFANIGI